jgi:hypothetical protein
MVVARTGPDTVALLDGNSSTAKPFGLSALDRNPNIDDVTQVGVNAWAVWQGGNNAYFTISAPAFDSTKSYTVPVDGSRALLYVGTSTAKGQITTTSGAAGPVAELIDVVSPTTIVIRLLTVGQAVA